MWKHYVNEWDVKTVLELSLEILLHLHKIISLLWIKEVKKVHRRRQEGRKEMLNNALETFLLPEKKGCGLKNLVALAKKGGNVLQKGKKTGVVIS